MLNDLIRIGAVTKGHPMKYNRRVVYLHTSTMFSLCDAIANKFKYDGVEVVIAASERNAVISQWVAYFLTLSSAGRKVPGIYAERSMRMGTILWCIWKALHGHASFEYEKLVRGKKVLVVEEFLHSDGSAQEIVEVVRYLGAHIIGLGAFCADSKEVSSRIDVPKIATLVSVI